MTDLVGGTVPASVRHLLHWIDTENIAITQFFGPGTGPSAAIPKREFDSKLLSKNYHNNNPDALNEALQDKPGFISIKKIQEYQLKLSGQAAPT